MKFRHAGMLMFTGFALAFALLYSIHFVRTPISPGKPVQVTIESGQSGWSISRALEEKRIITDAFMFFLTSRILGKATRLQAGDYVFEGNHYPLDVIDILFRGRTYKYRITIPEGSNIYQIGEIISATGLITKDQFVQCARSKEIMDFFKVSGPSMEGYLYPDTYFLAPHMTPLEITGRLFGRFKRMYRPEMDTRAEKLGLSRLEVLTLASLIEKEAVSAADKPLISSVFHNRLAIGMRLQSDPTAIYGIDGLKRKICPEDLERESPYNTYRHKGLPPGPICSPTADSIKAALFPAKTSYLYFVSRGDGTHTFSSSLSEHNRAVFENSRIRKKQQAL